MTEIGETEIRLSRLFHAVGQVEPAKHLIDQADALLVLQAIAEVVALRGRKRNTAAEWPPRDIDPWALARARVAVLFFDRERGDAAMQ